MSEIPREALGKGHDFEDDAPHALSSVERWTCKRCGAAVLRSRGYVYGSATEDHCIVKVTAR
ncbi:hypothetical protein [Streptomyces sp. t39]|uniref:hypothetical protein n=1 Tax=Streptomyces sp. t39 TaxID=1828156 RepID=UPI0011CD7C08|nr:hypothetical protein [Streptomyces sp. t39]TXS35263.1 hypothetical protein EAO77_37230 [Streptomyces sp. t39]